MKEINSKLMILYDTSPSISNYKRDIDNFTRLAGEPNKKAIQRYQNLLDRMKHLHTEGDWQKIREKMNLLQPNSSFCPMIGLILSKNMKVFAWEAIQIWQI